MSEKVQPGGSLGKLVRHRRRKRAVARWLTLIVLGVGVAGAVRAYGWLQHPESAPAAVRRFLPHPGAAATSGSAGAVEAALPSPGPAEDPGGFSFLHVDGRTGEPIRFNPCQTLHYLVNPTGAPAGGLTAVNEAIDKLSKATGIAFEPDGFTSEVSSISRANFQPSRSDHEWAPILIGWLPLGKPAGGHHGLAGVGGPGLPVAAGGGYQYVTGDLTLNSEANIPAQYLVPVLLHELGHVMGLGHVTKADQVMDPGGTARAYGKGDLVGFDKVGRPAGCLPHAKPGFES